MIKAVLPASLRSMAISSGIPGANGPAGPNYDDKPAIRNTLRDDDTEFTEVTLARTIQQTTRGSAQDHGEEGGGAADWPGRSMSAYRYQ